MFSVSLFTIYTSFFRQSDDGKPESLDLINYDHQLIQVNEVDDTGVGVKIIGPDYVLVGRQRQEWLP